MKFVHMADMHFDAPFVSLANKKNLAQERRLEQRKAMRDIVEYIKKNDIPYFFIAGDLYEQEYIKKSTIEYINNLFKEIPNTKVFITPGNHDPQIKNSFYNQYKWNDNVHIFTKELEVLEYEEVDIYGYGFNDFYMDNPYQNIKVKDLNKINILITHGSLDGGSDKDRTYNPMSSKDLKNSKFDYIALGHIHKRSFNEYKNQKIVYPGSTVSLGFDELGEKGIIVGSIEGQSKEKMLNMEFLPIVTKTFEEQEVNITDLSSIEDLIEYMNNLELDEDRFYKILLVGKRNFNIDVIELIKLIKIKNIIKIKDKTAIKYSIEEIAKQDTLKGIFAKNILKQLDEVDDNEKQKLLATFEIGMDALNK